MSLKNVAVGSNKIPSSQFDFSHKYQGTFAWGAVLPTRCRVLYTQGKTRLGSSHIVRLAPMQTPAFGKIIFRQYHQFVPFRSVYPSFNKFLANVPRLKDPVSHLVGKDSQLPSMTTDTLMSLLLAHSRCNVGVYARDLASDGTSDPSKTWVFTDLPTNVILSPCFK